MNIIECNQMIDAFMGSEGEYISYKDAYGGEVWGEYKPHNYHCDWNELMRVVEKIESLGYSFVIEDESSAIYSKDIHSTEDQIEACSERKIDSVYLACSVFIKTHNQP